MDSVDLDEAGAKTLNVDMAANANVTVRVDLARVRANAAGIKEQVRAGVGVYAVVKADAYGLGAREVAGAIGDLVKGFCCFSLQEALDAELWKLTEKPTLLLGPPHSTDPEIYRQHRVRPAVWLIVQAQRLREARPILCVDTGMHRFAAPEEQVDKIIRAGDIDEAFTHATRLEHVEKLKEYTRPHALRLHAAATALLEEPRAYLDAVRPGLALYRGAVRVSTNIVDARDSRGPAGYSGFIAPRHGVILCGYSHGLRKGPCLVGARPSRILEVGMQSAYVELNSDEGVGDEVILLGDSLTPEEIGAAWGCSPHEVLVRMCALGTKHHVQPGL